AGKQGNTEKSTFVDRLLQLRNFRQILRVFFPWRKWRRTAFRNTYYMTTTLLTSSQRYRRGGRGGSGAARRRRRTTSSRGPLSRAGRAPAPPRRWCRPRGCSPVVRARG